MNNPKKQQIVSTARDLFWKFGFRRVSIEEICREANVSKMTFYKHFKNKDELVKYIIDFITGIAMKKYREIMDSDIPFTEKVEKSIQLKMESSNDMSQEFFDDFHKNASPELHDHFNKLVHANLNTIQNDYIKAQKQGDVRPDINPNFILYYLDKMLEMAKDENLMRLYKSPPDLINELTRFFFYGILSRKT
ncbi:MAG: TetR/AcrR family transcriptional regulator [Bacteroidales bacterium]|nr:MAG: TetR/AcrR family transcriptional regulator [Bacteroidales bacterium]